MDELVQTLRNLGLPRLALMGGVALGLIAFFVFLTTRLSTPDMELLYGDLIPRDAGDIVAELEQAGVAHQVRERGDRSAILVPGDEVASWRMRLASQGLPNSGTVGNEIFDEGQSLGTTEFMQDMNRLRALEGELTRTLVSLSHIRSARVHIVMPEREMFSRDTREPSASVTLGTRGQLSDQQVAAIQHAIAAAVPSLAPGRVSVVDSAGNLLAPGTGESGSLMASRQEERRREFETRKRHDIIAMLTPMVGPGAVRVQVNADLDLDRVTTASETFDPEGQVVRSRQLREEESTSSEAGGGGVTVGNNIPGGGQQGGGGNGAGRESETLLEETTNYEINRTEVQRVEGAGDVQRISVAVLVDHKRPLAGQAAGQGGQGTGQGGQGTGQGGQPQPQPRSEAELAEIEALVKSAIGFDDERGDRVHVANMPFVDMEAGLDTAQASLPFGFEQDDVMRLAELAVLSALVVLVLVLVVRPLVTKALTAPPRQPEAAAEGDYPLITDQSASGRELPGPETVAAEEGETEVENMINISQVEGKVRASSLRKIGEIVDKHPEEAVSILRTWMQQEA